MDRAVMAEDLREPMWITFSGASTRLNESREELLPRPASYSVPSEDEVPLPACIWPTHLDMDLADIDKVQISAACKEKQVEPSMKEWSSQQALQSFSRVERQFVKTRVCLFYSRGKCSFGTECRFAHSDGELRWAPDLSKTRLCVRFERSKCFDLNCRFAHGVADLRATPGVYKTAMCRSVVSGKCSRGELCRFAHSLAELQQDHPC
eukprot:TRINITY_DN54649_c0_g1_i1.p1 TRINITY_DN54649_c0_g1~~TRINITY_DN54649_c0_g1_i1.p1  ORF type:complete len:207 (-),score=10.24 TRINITY_DN54649_c0_g1_i1:568-1188(-)